MNIAASEKHIIHLYISPKQLREMADKMEALEKQIRLGGDTTVVELLSDDERYSIHVRLPQG
jgi:hypothetical protein